MRGTIICTVTLVLAMCVGSSWGYGSGAPAKACVTLHPGHTDSPNAQTSPSPYNLSVQNVDGSPYDSKAKITDKPIKVKVSGTFVGLILQARDGADGTNTVPYGKWLTPPADTKTTKCTADSDTITHANTKGKTDVVFEWQPPSSGRPKKFVFAATVAKSKSMYWMGIKSAIINGASFTQLTIIPMFVITIMAAAIIN